ncbi:hypothetical protein CEXT_68181 [Caerostris extrusa]|uniref:Uncharacterized protein n=1 Tax=Caerostris extrusa TaxID=172846 RepID=A0AAV4Y7A3_CAEEX|nr:hypothetical protein CEXT_68181 [Caerostris extrusa]
MCRLLLDIAHIHSKTISKNPISVVRITSFDNSPLKLENKDEKKKNSIPSTERRKKKKRILRQRKVFFSLSRSLQRKRSKAFYTTSLFFYCIFLSRNVTRHDFPSLHSGKESFSYREEK